MLSRNFLIRFAYSTVLIGSLCVTLMIVSLLKSKIYIFQDSQEINEVAQEIEPFPVSVNLYTEVIDDNPAVNEFFAETLANDSGSRDNWWNQVAAVFATKGWYQNLASPVSRIVVIWPGERKEEATKKISEILRWDEEDKMEFQSLVNQSSPVMLEGKYFPGQYVTHRNATPSDVTQLILESFEKEVLARYTPEVEQNVPLTQALIIASLLEREASDFNNMREVAGVIWNRLFIDMPLQLDATLQYARGSRTYERSWWPKVVPNDKYIDSPFNTYQNSGLPPAPIANPSAEAILAALNPIKTDCLYYFHASKGRYYCSPTYEEHVSKLRSLYGRGS